MAHAGPPGVRGSMRIEAERAEDGTTCLRLQGSLTAETRAQLDERLRGSADFFMSLNLSQVEQLDLAGVGALLNAARELRSRGGGLTLQAVSPSVRRALTRIHLHWLLEGSR